MSFEVPCACGRRLSVTAGDAGTTLRCGCGRTVEVPGLQQLRVSAPTPEPTPAPAQRDLYALRLVGPVLVVGSFLWELIVVARGLPSDAVGILITLLGGLALFAVGVILWAVGKGHRPLYGLLLAITGPIGVFILLFMPSRER